MYVFNDTNNSVTLSFYLKERLGYEDIFGNTSRGKTRLEPEDTFEIPNVIMSDNVYFAIPTRGGPIGMFNCTYRYFVDRPKPTIRVSTILSNCGSGNDVDTGF